MAWGLAPNSRVPSMQDDTPHLREQPSKDGLRSVFLDAAGVAVGAAVYLPKNASAEKIPTRAVFNIRQIMDTSAWRNRKIKLTAPHLPAEITTLYDKPEQLFDEPCVWIVGGRRNFTE